MSGNCAKEERAMSSQRGQPRRQLASSKLIEIVVALAFLALLIVVILPWAGQSLAEGFSSITKQPR
jgi:hypothetical protein